MNCPGATFAHVITMMPDVVAGEEKRIIFLSSVIKQFNIYFTSRCRKKFN